MRKILRIAKANASGHKGATISLFIIVAIVSALMTVALSVLTQLDSDFRGVTDSRNSMHNVFVIPRDEYKASFDDFLRNDPRVSQFERTEALFADSPSVYYGSKTDINVIVASLSEKVTINAPEVTEHDDAVPPGFAIYLPEFARNFGFVTGDPFSIVHRNREIDLTVAGFFETTVFANSQQGALRFYVTPECYEQLTQYFNRSVYIALRLYDADDALQFHSDFSDEAEIDFFFFNGGAFAWNIQESAVSALSPVYTMSAIILLFAAILTLVSIFVIRFRVRSSIENSLHEIGVLKAQGYTNRQISACYLTEYMALSLPAAVLGAIVSIPVFPPVRRMFFTMSGFPWTFGVSAAAGVLSVVVISLSLLLMVWRSARSVRKLAPVTALRGDLAVNTFRRNFLPLKKFSGNIHLGLGLKNMFAYFKLYAMIGLIIAGISLAIIFMAVLYQNFVMDQTALLKMTGVDVSDVAVTVTRHTDAAALAAEMERMPEVRKTSMIDLLGFKVEGYDTFASVSDDFSKIETITAGAGRMPLYDNEIAIPGVFMRLLGKEIGDAVTVKSNGVTQLFIITGNFPAINNGGKAAMITLGGYQRLDPDYKRNSINVYLNDGVTPAEFSEILERQFGVLNVYREGEDSRFSAAKARAEEKISAMLEHYDVDSVSYAVIYNGDIILKGSSDTYQIEKIIDFREYLNAQLGNYTGAIGAVTQMIVLVSLLISSLILVMTVRSIISKRRRELGILKSNGFTTKQLARQMAISFLPMTAFGVVLGCAAGAFTVSPAMGAALSAAGAENVALAVDPLIVTILGAVILLVTYIVANISALRIKHISVYELLTE